MISTLIDSNVIIDVLTGDARWRDWSMRAVAEARSEGRTVINPLIYAEVAVAFQTEDETEAGLPATLYDREGLPWDAAFVAGHAHLMYRRRGGLRERTLPDFLIGAHASVKGYRLLTRDARRYRAYFPDLHILDPETQP